MNGNSFVLDTNAVVYILQGDEELADLLYGERLVISVVTEMELLSYPSMNKDDLQQVSNFLSSFEILQRENSIKEIAIGIRRKWRLKLPDSIIAATAIHLHLPLISADKKLRNVEGLDLILVER